MRFVALDVETANPNMSSVCQIGLVVFENCIEVEAHSHLIDPNDYFDPYNVAIHGIDKAAVKGAPTFADLHGWLGEKTSDATVVSHTHFDRVSMSQSCERFGLSPLTCSWLDSARVGRRAWPQFARSGYGLANLAAHCGISFTHHDAVQDARAAGLIVIRAAQDHGISIADWAVRASRRASNGDVARRAGDGDGALLGETIVFTGALSIGRSTAADMAAMAGGNVNPGVTKHTTMLVVGDQDIARLNGADKSGKHRKAEALIAGGQPIRIVGESDFLALATITE